MSMKNDVSKEGLTHLLRDVDRPDQRGAQHLPPAEHEVFDKADFDVIARWEANLLISCKKALDFLLTPIFGRE